MENSIAPRVRYDRFSRILHWAVAVIIIYAMFMGYLLHALQGTPYFQFFSVLNMTLGTLATPVMIVRFSWRFFRPSVPYAADVSRMKKNVLVFAHEIFYLAIFVTLISGFLMLQNGYNLFGLFPIPQPVTSLEVNKFFFELHRYACITVGVILLGHVFAVAKHYFSGNRSIIRRMF
ncbi:cytochrome B [Rouxiella silvae]|uniref:Cytochrome B n=1 Tax=Rouxiella silvae TaxID=1646373 RepID=A0AA40X6L4_9GAMM|nr:cytochrome b/b6 domain-containing protein [Rouxiella silvae]KQN50515.1 cytochrome B [Serratia sp. Leaf50]MBF6639626.1 cytochrome b/b6 domain-containing protein [Rouxiella silvae]ORJ22729.1 cytochrome B [Rouxiella silvae]